MLTLASEILSILEKKLLNIRPVSQGDLYIAYGRDILLEKIQSFINVKQPIQLLLPAFPCKSPNLEKVCQKLPDGGEMYALENLNGICRDISLLYEYGCRLVIWSDGRVFGDLLGVSDEDIENYECKLRHFAMTMTHISWDNMSNYLGNENGDSLVSKYGTPTFSFEEWLKKCENNYKQFIHLRKFMETDLRNVNENKILSRRQLTNRMSSVAQKMIERNDALANLLKQNYPNHIRLSIHQHVNDGEKFTVRLFADRVAEADTHCGLRTPWHNVLVIQPNGSLTLTPYKKLNFANEHISITFKDQIWCFVTLPSSMQSSTASKIKLSFAGNSSRFGLAIDLSNEVNVFQLDISWMKMLIERFGFIVLRQCKRSLEKTEFTEFCEQFSQPVMWKFGSLLTIKPESTPTSTHSSREELPLHFDLAYPPEYLMKTGVYEDYVPQYFMLYCAKAPPLYAGGKTTFANGRLILEGTNEKEIIQWKNMSIKNSIPLTYYGGTSYKNPIIRLHPKTNETLFRYLEKSNSKMQQMESKCSINEVDIADNEYEEFNQRMKRIMYDSRWYMEHTWKDDDLVIIENHIMLHGRTCVREQSERELWRIQVY